MLCHELAKVGNEVYRADVGQTPVLLPEDPRIGETVPIMNQAEGNIGFVATRLAGMDGVSLESRKWGRCLENAGFRCHYLAGKLDQADDRCLQVEEAHFAHPAIRDVYHQCFQPGARPRELTTRIHEIKERLKDRLYDFIAQFELDLLIAENSLAIPLNIPLGLALTEVIAETGIRTIAHHHDLFWERQRFLTNCVWDYLNMSFPPHLPTIRHVVINSSADNQLSLRSGISATVIPNVMDFEGSPAAPGDYAESVKEDLGFRGDELFVLQPTRVVPRKRIELAVDLVRRLDLKAKLVISHASGDEGYEYERDLRSYAESLGVDARFVSDIIGDARGRTADGRKVYALADVYPHADIVTYPSVFEGFGNAFLEAIYYRKPLVVNNYSIYALDIKPKGFRVVELNGYVSDDSVRRTREVLQSPKLVREMVEENYALARRYFSYSVLKRKLEGLVADCIGG